MFRPEEVIPALLTRIGWKQPTEEGYVTLTGDNLVAASGLYFSDYHKAVTVRNIKETLQDPAMSDADFNIELLQFQRSAINRVMQGVFNQDVVIEQKQLYSRDWGKNLTALNNSGQFVGFRVKVANDQSYSVRVNSMSLMFNGIKTFNIYLFHSAKGLLQTKSVTTLSGIETIININDWILSISKADQKAGVYYIGYFQSDLGTVKAINNYSSRYASPLIFGFTGFEANPTGAATYNNQTIVETSLDYGINLEMTSVRDFTAVILRNAYAFDRAVGLQVACDVIEQIIMSTRSNATERITKEVTQQLFNDLNAEYATEGQTMQPYSAGLKNQLRSELKKLNTNFFPKDTPFIQTA